MRMTFRVWFKLADEFESRALLVTATSVSNAREKALTKIFEVFETAKFKLGLIEILDR